MHYWLSAWKGRDAIIPFKSVAEVMHYFNGLRDGVMAFGIYRSGIQLCGSQERPISEVYAEIRDAETEALQIVSGR